MIRRAAALGLVGLALGCSPEGKAKDVLEKYETAFEICKEETEKTGVKPGEHRCAKVTSMAVEMSLKDTGLEEDEWRSMLDAWLKSSGYEDFYLPPEEREEQ